MASPLSPLEIITAVFAPETANRNWQPAISLNIPPLMFMANPFGLEMRTFLNQQLRLPNMLMKFALAAGEFVSNEATSQRSSNPMNSSTGDVFTPNIGAAVLVNVMQGGGQTVTLLPLATAIICTNC